MPKTTNDECYLEGARTCFDLPLPPLASRRLHVHERRLLRDLTRPPGCYVIDSSSAACPTSKFHARLIADLERSGVMIFPAMERTVAAASGNLLDVDLLVDNAVVVEPALGPHAVSPHPRPAVDDDTLGRVQLPGLLVS